MTRVAVILVSFLATVAGASWYLVHGDRARLLSVGDSLYVHRGPIAPVLEARHPAPDVVWLGDSTIVSSATAPGYPEMAQAQVLGPIGLQSLVAAAGGLDLYGQYGLMGPALAQHPRLVVMIVNLRLLDPKGDWPFNDLLAFVPPTELPRLLTLPYGIRGMTAPRLVLVQLLRSKTGWEVVRLLEGMRRSVADSPRWAIFGPVRPPQSVEAAGSQLKERMILEYDRWVGPSAPLVRLATEAVRMATRSGVRALVIVTPVPIEALRVRGLYDPERIAQQVGVFREAITAAGGTFLDLHAALGSEGMSDELGHLSPQGKESMIRATMPAVLAALGRADAAQVPPQVLRQ